MGPSWAHPLACQGIFCLHLGSSSSEQTNGLQKNLPGGLGTSTPEGDDQPPSPTQPQDDCDIPFVKIFSGRRGYCMCNGNDGAQTGILYVC